MKNIVATIQCDQNAIIRNDRTHTLVIQGAAGFGPPIALHRIAFLLYKFKDSSNADPEFPTRLSRYATHVRKTNVRPASVQVGRCVVKADCVAELLRHYGRKPRKTTVRFAGRLLGPMVASCIKRAFCSL